MRSLRPLKPQPVSTTCVACGRRPPRKRTSEVHLAPKQGNHLTSLSRDAPLTPPGTRWHEMRCGGRLCWNDGKSLAAGAQNPLNEGFAFTDALFNPWKVTPTRQVPLGLSHRTAGGERFDPTESALRVLQSAVANSHPFLRPRPCLLCRPTAICCLASSRCKWISLAATPSLPRCIRGC